MRTISIIAVIGCILILAAGLVAGCIETSGTTATKENTDPHPTTISTAVVPFVPVPADTGVTSGTGAMVRTLFVNSTSDGKIITIPIGDSVLVRLNENPTTGYTWNTTISKGLTVLKDTYTAPDTTRVGAGGYHEWILSPQTVDTYTFRAVSLRPWEGVQSSDETFSLVIQATRN
jgi:inhibitor of cysteine peptidase